MGRIQHHVSFVGPDAVAGRSDGQCMVCPSRRALVFRLRARSIGHGANQRSLVANLDAGLRRRHPRPRRLQHSHQASRARTSRCVCRTCAGAIHSGRRGVPRRGARSCNCHCGCTGGRRCSSCEWFGQLPQTECGLTPSLKRSANIVPRNANDPSRTIHQAQNSAWKTR